MAAREHLPGGIFSTGSVEPAITTNAHALYSGGILFSIEEIYSFKLKQLWQLMTI